MFCCELLWQQHHTTGKVFKGFLNEVVITWTAALHRIRQRSLLTHSGTLEKNQRPSAGPRATRRLSALTKEVLRVSVSRRRVYVFYSSVLHVRPLTCSQVFGLSVGAVVGTIFSHTTTAVGAETESWPLIGPCSQLTAAHRSTNPLTPLLLPAQTHHCGVMSLSLR